MWRFIFVTFAFLGWAFYELSGGADYQPRSYAALRPPAKAAQSSPDSAITRAQNDAALDRLPDAKTTLAAATAKAVKAATPAAVATLGVTPVKAARPAAKSPPAPTAVSFTATQSDAAIDLRRISGNRVNLRLGPGTEFNKIGQLLQGTEVEILQDPGNGWVKLRVTETRRVGWMADYLVTAAN